MIGQNSSSISSRVRELQLTLVEISWNMINDTTFLENQLDLYSFFRISVSVSSIKAEELDLGSSSVVSVTSRLLLGCSDTVLSSAGCIATEYFAVQEMPWKTKLTFV